MTTPLFGFGGACYVLYSSINVYLLAVYRSTPDRKGGNSSARTWG
jgi:hypothetical protein